jgi:hypothetical protein
MLKFPSVNVTDECFHLRIRPYGGHVGGRLLLRHYDLYQRLQLQFLVLLMMGAMDTRNM